MRGIEFYLNSEKRLLLFPQPSGHALPAITPSGITTRIQHLNSAILSDPCSFNLKRAARSGDFRNINRILRGPNEVREYRENALAQLEEISDKLAPLYQNGLRLSHRIPLLEG